MKGNKMIEYKDREYPRGYTFEVRWDNDQMRDFDKEYKGFNQARAVASRNQAPTCKYQGHLGRSYIVVLDDTHTPVQQVWE